MNKAEVFFDKLNILNEEIKVFNKTLSEADTRVKLIDTLFTNCLDWEEQYIKREESYKSGDNTTQYIDYIFNSEKNKFLVEAKKSGIYFNVPNSNNHFFKSNGILSSDKETKKAINQAMEYCKDNGINIGCVTNGNTYFIFSLTLNTNRYDTYCFKSLDDIIQNATFFYNLFATNSNAQNVLEQRLIENCSNIREKPDFLKNALDCLPDRNITIARNPIDNQIRIIINKYFKDLTSDNKKMLEECYCYEDRYLQYEKQLSELLHDGLPRLDNPVQESKFFYNDFLKNKKDNKSLFGTNSVMVIVGGVGSGKTTFLKHFYNIKMNSDDKRNLIWLYIDFTKISKENIEAIDIIYENILEQLDTRYSHLKINNWDTIIEIYKPLIKRLQMGPLKPYYDNDRKAYDIKISDKLMEETENKVNFCKNVLKYILMQTKYTICLVLDNTDQKTDEFQKRMLLAAHEFSEAHRCLTLLSMREESYWKFKNIHPLDAYSGSAYHISAPHVSDLISKRIEFACNEIGRQRLVLNMKNGIPVTISVLEFFTMIKESLKSKDNSFMNVELFEALSSNNMRYATEILQSFLTSGHTNTDEYISYYVVSGNYTIPKHAFIRSIALGDYKYYHSDKSNIFNILSIEEDGFYSHFNKLRILKYLNENSQIDSLTGKGYIKIKDMYKEFSPIYSSIENFKNTIEILMKNRLVQVDKGFNTPIEIAEYVKISSSGYYYINDLLYEFSYMERLLEDTPISNKFFHDMIVDCTTNLKKKENENVNKRLRMDIRIKRISLFLNYLIELEKSESEMLSSFLINYKFMEKCKQTIMIQIIPHGSRKK